LLGGYEQFCEFDDRERSLIEPLRTLRMLRHSAWLAERWSDPTFPQNFPFFHAGLLVAADGATARTDRTDGWG
jgi:Ser/Thr protein kinase RdoA (MazF antagonist)